MDYAQEEYAIKAEKIHHATREDKSADEIS